MPYQRSKHRRRSIRLKGHDYASPGAYFVTINVHESQSWLGRVVEGETHLNEYGRVALECWRAIPDHFPHVEVDAFAVMPNHVHGLIVITDVVRTSSTDRPFVEPTAPADQTGAQLGIRAPADQPIPGVSIPVGATHASPLPELYMSADQPPLTDRSPAPPRVSTHGTMDDRTSWPPLSTDQPLPPCGPTSVSIGAIVGSFKSASTRRINEMRGTPGGRFWQRNYYERFIRDDASLRRIRRYIQTNPSHGVRLGDLCTNNCRSLH